MRRFVVEALPPDGAATVTLDAATSHYAAHVLRLPVAAVIELVDGAGGQVVAELTGGDAEHGLTARVLERRQHNRPVTQVTLAAALLKGPRWEILLEKAAELGVHTVVPIEAARSVVKISDKDRSGKQQRWQKICDGATRQSGGLWRCDVQLAASLTQALAALKEGSLALLADESNPTTPWPDRLRSHSDEAPVHVVVFVGPEGGFTDDERSAIAGHAVRVGLGARILRGETAGIAALSILMAMRQGLV